MAIPMYLVVDPGHQEDMHSLLIPTEVVKQRAVHGILSCCECQPEKGYENGACAMH
jgi:hypothetical protein